MILRKSRMFSGTLRMTRGDSFLDKEAYGRMTKVDCGDEVFLLPVKVDDPRARA